MSIEKYKKDIAALLQRGESLHLTMLLEQYPESKDKLGLDKEALKKLPAFSEKYQQWYSEALVCLEQLLPSRADYFVSYYKPTKSRKSLTVETYTIADYLKGISVTLGCQKTKVVGLDAAINPFKQQLHIIESLKSRFESTLFDIKTLIQADIFDHEIDAASELMKNGYLRASGAL